MSKPVIIGLDIGGTKILAAAATREGQIIQQRREATPVDLDAGLALLRSMVEEFAWRGRLVAIGAAIGGPLDWQSGIVSPLHQPQWRNVPLKHIMETTFGCPFVVDVDTNVAALGEYHLDPEKPPRLLYLTLSTGMGGGFVVDGEIYRGTNGAHPEVGHQSVPFRCRFPERVQCECGAPDCLEALVSGNAIRRIYRKPAEQLSKDEWEEVAWNFGQGLRNLAVVYAPDVIAVGGGVAIGAAEKLLPAATTVMKQHLNIVPVPRVRLSRAGYDAPLVGAIDLARRGAL